MMAHNGMKRMAAAVVERSDSQVSQPMMRPIRILHRLDLAAAMVGLGLPPQIFDAGSVLQQPQQPAHRQRRSPRHPQLFDAAAQRVVMVRILAVVGHAGVSEENEHRRRSTPRASRSTAAELIATRSSMRREAPAKEPASTASGRRSLPGTFRQGQAPCNTRTDHAQRKRRLQR